MVLVLFVAVYMGLHSAVGIIGTVAVTVVVIQHAFMDVVAARVTSTLTNTVTAHDDFDDDPTMLAPSPLTDVLFHHHHHHHQFYHPTLPT